MFREGDRVRLTDAARLRLQTRREIPTRALAPGLVGVVAAREDTPQGVRYLVEVEGYPLALREEDLAPA